MPIRTKAILFKSRMHHGYFIRVWGYVTALLVLATTFNVLCAQTTFARASRPVNVAQYQTLEECGVLVARMEREVNLHDSTAIDTFPIAVYESRRRTPFPPSLVTAAQTCAASLSLEQIPVSTEVAILQQLDIVVPLLLRANRDTDANRIVTRLLASIPPLNGTASDEQRIGVIEKVTEWYREARPARDTVAFRILTTELQTPTIAAFPKLVLLSRTAAVATETRDTVLMLEWTKRAVSAYRQFMAQPSASSFDGRLNTLYRMIMRRLTQAELLDSLSRSVATYVSLRKTDQAFLNRMGDPLPRIGDHSPTLQGDFWFRRGDTNAVAPLVRPSPGKTSLIIFLSHQCRRRADALSAAESSSEDGCVGLYAMLKRLIPEFPNVEVTLAVQTQGYWGEVAPLEPEAEAGLFRQWWLDFHKLPAALAVVNTPFWRLEDPDRRRINEENPNARMHDTSFQGAVLTDRNGVIVERFHPLSRADEPWLRQLLILLEHQN